MHWYIEVLKKYATFRGRARRREYWILTLVNFLIVLVVAGITEILPGAEDVLFFILGVYWFAIILPSLAVSVRRLHDTGRSGWWLLLGIVPFLGIVVLIFMLLAGNHGENRYGPDPKAPIAV